MYFEELLKRSYIKSEPPTDEEVVLLLSGCRPQIDHHLVVSKQDFDEILMNNRAKDPTSEAVLMTLGRTGVTPGDPVWDAMLQHDSVIDRFTQLCNAENARTLSALEGSDASQDGAGAWGAPSGFPEEAPGFGEGSPGFGFGTEPEPVGTGQGPAYGAEPAGEGQGFGYGAAPAGEESGFGFGYEPGGEPAAGLGLGGEAGGFPEGASFPEGGPVGFGTGEEGATPGFGFEDGGAQVSGFGFGGEEPASGFGPTAESGGLEFNSDSFQESGGAESQFGIPAGPDGMGVYLDSPLNHRAYDAEFTPGVAVEDAPAPGASMDDEAGGEQFGSAMPGEVGEQFGSAMPGEVGEQFGDGVPDTGFASQFGEGLPSEEGQFGAELPEAEGQFGAEFGAELPAGEGQEFAPQFGAELPAREGQEFAPQFGGPLPADGDALEGQGFGETFPGEGAYPETQGFPGFDAEGGQPLEGAESFGGQDPQEEAYEAFPEAAPQPTEEAYEAFSEAAPQPVEEGDLHSGGEPLPQELPTGAFDQGLLPGSNDTFVPQPEPESEPEPQPEPQPLAQTGYPPNTGISQQYVVSGYAAPLPEEMPMVGDTQVLGAATARQRPGFHAGPPVEEASGDEGGLGTLRNLPDTEGEGIPPRGTTDEFGQPEPMEDVNPIEGFSEETGTAGFAGAGAPAEELPPESLQGNDGFAGDTEGQFDAAENVAPQGTTDPSAEEMVQSIRASFELFHGLVKQHTLPVILASEGLTSVEFCNNIVAEFPMFTEQYTDSLNKYGDDYDRAACDLVQLLQLEAESAVFCADLDGAEKCIAPVYKLIYS